MVGRLITSENLLNYLGAPNTTNLGIAMDSSRVDAKELSDYAA
jgi:hypothetical protein